MTEWRKQIVRVRKFSLAASEKQNEHFQEFYRGEQPWMTVLKGHLVLIISGGWWIVSEGRGDVNSTALDVIQISWDKWPSQSMKHEQKRKAPKILYKILYARLRRMFQTRRQVIQCWKVKSCRREPESTTRWVPVVRCWGLSSPSALSAGRTGPGALWRVGFTWQVSMTQLQTSTAPW